SRYKYRISSRSAAIPRKAAGGPRRRSETRGRPPAPVRGGACRRLFPGQAEMLRRNRSIATMDAFAPLPPLRGQVLAWAEASALARQWDLKQFADRLAELGTQDEPIGSVSGRGHVP